METYKNIVTFGIIALLVLSLLPLALADPDLVQNCDNDAICLTAKWLPDVIPSLTIDQGEAAEFFLIARANSDFDLSATLTTRDHALLAIVIPEREIPFSFDTPSYYRESFVNTDNIQPGDYILKIRAANVDGTVYQFLNLHINEESQPQENHKPVITSTPLADDLLLFFPIYNVVIGEEFDIQFRATDEDVGDRVSLTITPQEENTPGIIDRNLDAWGEISGTPQQVAEYHYILTADDSKEITQVGIILKVNPEEQPPVENTPPILIASTTEATVNEGNTLTITASADDPDNQQITFEAAGARNWITRFLDNIIGQKALPAGASFDSQTGELTFSPDYTFVEHPDLQRTTKVKFRAFDGEEYSDWEKVTIYVNDVNRAPVVQDREFTTARNTPVTFLLTASDPDQEDSALVQVTDLPNHGTLSGASIFITYTPEDNFLGQDTFYYRGYDQLGALSERASVKINVVESTDNHAPVLDPIGDKEIQYDHDLIFIVSASDLDNDPLTFTVSNLPEGAYFEHQKFAWAPTEEQIGIYQVKFIVSDSQSEDSEIITISVTGEKGNHAPILNKIGDKETAEGQLLQFLVTASDPDNDPVTITVEDLPLGAIFQDQKFTWTPGFDQAGIYRVKFTASDSQLQDSEIVTITVGNTKVAPEITSYPPTRATEDEQYTYQIEVSGDGPITYHLVQAPSGMTITEDGLIQWIPRDSQAAHVTIRINDNTGMTAEQSYKITVRPAYQNIRLETVQLSQDIVTPGEYLTIHTNIVNNGDKDLDDVQIVVTVYELQQQLKSGDFDLNEGESKSTDLFMFVPYEITPGTYTVKITAKNDHFTTSTYREFTVY